VRIARFSHDGDVSFGVIEGETIAQISAHPFGPVEFTGGRAPLSSVRLLAPVLPSKVVAIGRNYAEHASEMGGDVPEKPLIFLKPSTAVIASGDEIASPASSRRVDFEGELAVVISRLCRDVPEERAMDVVLGYTCGNDVTARDQQRADGQWSRAKGYDTFCPLGPWIATPDELGDPHDLRMELRVNGEVRQESHSSRMSVTIPEILSNFSALGYSAGDVLSTGTVAGVAGFKSEEERKRLYLKPGDVIEAEIEKIGVLRNPVVSWQEAHGGPPPPRIRPWGDA
jgi:2-keto-4-pentenoate hydratase/2-oxohepta-3-ene-1,7-dioic acid hydratase in catechol pathway